MSGSSPGRKSWRNERTPARNAPVDHAGRDPGLLFPARRDGAATKSMPTPDRSACSALSTASPATCSFPASRPIAPASRSMPAISPARRSPRSSPPIMAIAEQGLHRSHFGFPNFFVPFITTSDARLRSMMDLLDRMTAGRGSKMLLFKTFPSFTSPEKPPPAERTHADRAMAAGRLSPALSRSLNRMDRRQNRRPERPAPHHLQGRPGADDAAASTTWTIACAAAPSRCWRDTTSFDPTASTIGAVYFCRLCVRVAHRIPRQRRQPVFADPADPNRPCASLRSTRLTTCWRMQFDGRALRAGLYSLRSPSPASGMRSRPSVTIPRAGWMAPLAGGSRSRVPPSASLCSRSYGCLVQPVSGLANGLDPFCPLALAHAPFPFGGDNRRGVERSRLSLHA